MILVLEDSQDRIEWLRSLRLQCPIHIEDSVPRFSRLFERYKAEAKLLILDHDLGKYKTGSHFTAETNFGGMGATVIIWSTNPAGAMYMHKDLQRWGVPSTVVPYYSHNLSTLKQMIESVI